MSFVTPNMGLTAWDLPSDKFNRTEFANNWSTVDVHDHTLGKGVQIPTDGIANLAVTTGKIAASSIDGVRVADAAVTDAVRQSPNNQLWRTMFQAFNFQTNSFVSATYLLQENGGTAINNLSSVSIFQFRLDPAEHVVAGKTTQLRVRVCFTTNDVAPGASYTFGLYPLLSTGGGNSTLTQNLAGAPTPGSTVAITTPAADLVNVFDSGTFNFPAAGVYTLGFILSATAATNSAVSFSVYLQERQV